MRTIVLTASVLGLFAGCRAATQAPAATPAVVALPGSALAGAVRALETVQALRPEGTWTLVRAITCDTRQDTASLREFERVFLDVTVFAPTHSEAVTGYEALWAALAAEARAAERVEATPAGRVRVALAGLGRLPAGERELVSHSGRIRLEVQPGAALLAEELEPGRQSSDDLLRYVQTRASRPEGIGPVKVQLTDAPLEGALRLALAPAERSQRFTLAQIADFLASLEGESPAVRVSALAIEPSQHEPDPVSARRWTFTAELAVRAQPTASGEAGRQ